MRKWRFRTVWLSVVALIVLAGTINLAITARQLETAPDVLAITFQDAALGWIGWGYEPVTAMSGSRQAEFWLAETERVLADNPTSEMARGAAWMLDSPAATFNVNYWQPTDLAHGLPTGSFRRETEEFESKAAQKRVDFASMATRLSPDDVLTWRTRSRLLFHSKPWYGWTPRYPQWLQVLDEASSHDPDNAYYNYLAAEGLWYESGSVDPTGDVERLIIRDPKQFAAGVQHFERANQMASTHGADADWQAVQTFLQNSRVPKREQLYLLSSRLPQMADTRFAYFLLRFHALWAEAELPDLSRLPQGLRAAEQLDPSDFARLTDFIGDRSNYEPSLSLSSSLTSKLLRSLETNADRISKEDLTAVEEQMVAIYTRVDIRATARTDIPQPNWPARTSLWQLNNSLAMLGVLRCGLCLALAALALYGISRALAGSEVVRQWRFSPWRHLLAWLVAFSMSFAVFGLAPAEIVSVQVQHVLAQLLSTLLPVAGLVWLFFVLRRQRKSRMAGLTLLIVVPLLGALLVAWRDRFVDSVTRLTGLHVPHRLVAGMDEYQIERIDPTFKSGSPIAAWFQWLSYPGPASMVALALVLVAGWYWNWSGRQRNDVEPRPRRARLSGTALETTRSAACGTVVALLLFLLLAPLVLQDVQSSYDSQLAWFRDVPKRREQFAAAIAAIEADPVRSAEMRQWAADQIEAERAQQK